MKEKYHIIFELMLIVASIFIFRSIWLILDIYLGNNYLIPLLIAGLLLSIPPLYILNKHWDNE